MSVFNPTITPLEAIEELERRRKDWVNAQHARKMKPSPDHMRLEKQARDHAVVYDKLLFPRLKTTAELLNEAVNLLIVRSCNCAITMKNESCSKCQLIERYYIHRKELAKLK